MKHTIEVIDQKESTDEHVSLCFRCCNDSSTDSWATISLNLPDGEVTEALSTHKAGIARRHESKLQYRAGKHAANLAHSSEVIL